MEAPVKAGTPATRADAVVRRPRRRGPSWGRRIALALLVVGVVVVAWLALSDRETAPAAVVSNEPLALPAASQPTGREFFAAPEGVAQNPGTREAPIDLATALSNNTPASPGDVIWLRQGTYAGNFTSSLVGKPEAPIHVRQYPGERATIASARLDQPALVVTGAWTWLMGFEVTASPSARTRQLEQPADMRQTGGVLVRGSNIALINLVVHDIPQGIGILQDAERALVAGNLVYYIWWPDPPRGTGIRTISGKGDQFVVGNIVFGQGTTGISAGSVAGGRTLLDNNVSFNNGLHGDYYDRNLLAEGGSITARRNYTYYEPVRGGGENNFGYTTGCTQLEATDNYFAHRAYPFTLSKCQGRVSGNVFIGPVDPAVVNRYTKNTFLLAPPTGLRTFVDQDSYNPNRIRIVVYNWDKHAAVNVDMTGVPLDVGTPYEIRDAQNYYGGPVTTGVYEGGRLNIPLTSLKIVAPAMGEKIGAGLTHTAPEFAVFLLRKLPAATADGARGRGVPASGK
jgi:hypothetical protein